MGMFGHPHFLVGFHMAHTRKPYKTGICGYYGMEIRLFLAMFSPVTFG